MSTEEGARTLDHWIHNPVLYQLSYLGIGNKHYILRYPNSEAKACPQDHEARANRVELRSCSRLAPLWSRAASAQSSRWPRLFSMSGMVSQLLIPQCLPISILMSLDRIQVVFEDESLVVVDKPAGLLTMGTETERSRTVYAALREAANRKRPPEKIFIVHRLDREASGLLVFAKTIEAKEGLQEQFKDHSAGRRYVAVVDGRVTPENFTIRSYLAENAAFRVYSTRRSGEGKLAVTHVHVVKAKPKATLVEVRLETGRKHQIRVHLAERGHPIVGDKVYGSRSNPIRRMALHAAQLDFRHPATGKPMHFESRYPKAFSGIL
jgi:RluA family pseudouridine synthase